MLSCLSFMILTSFQILDGDGHGQILYTLETICGSMLAKSVNRKIVVEGDFLGSPPSPSLPP